MSKTYPETYPKIGFGTFPREYVVEWRLESQQRPRKTKLNQKIQWSDCRRNTTACVKKKMQHASLKNTPQSKYTESYEINTPSYDRLGATDEILGHKNSINETSAYTLSFRRAPYASQHIFILSNNMFTWSLSLCYVVLLCIYPYNYCCTKENYAKYQLIIIILKTFENIANTFVVYKIDTKTYFVVNFKFLFSITFSPSQNKHLMFRNDAKKLGKIHNN